MSTRDLTFTAGETKELGSGEHFILLECNAAVTVEFYKNASPLNLYSGVLGGFKYSAPEEPIYEGGLIVGTRSVRFDSVRITSATAQTIKADVSTGDVDYSRLQGSVSISSEPTPLASAENMGRFTSWSDNGGSQSIIAVGLHNPSASGVNLVLDYYTLMAKVGTSASTFQIYCGLITKSSWDTAASLAGGTTITRNGMSHDSNTDIGGSRSAQGEVTYQNSPTASMSPVSLSNALKYTRYDTVPTTYDPENPIANFNFADQEGLIIRPSHIFAVVLNATGRTGSVNMLTNFTWSEIAV